MELGVNGEDLIHEGYTTTDEYPRGAEYDWICPSCFEQFREAMGWVDATPPDSDGTATL